MPDGANHVAFAYSADGKDRLTTTHPNFNLLDGTKDFSGDWWLSDLSENDGTYTDNNSNEQSADPEKHTWKKKNK